MSSPNSLPRLAQLRQRLLERFGKRALHAVEDGLTVGLLVGLGLTFWPLAAGLATVLTGVPRSAGVLALLREVPEIVRGSDARAQESWFVGAVVVGLLIGLGAGTLASLAASINGIAVPALPVA
jgi:uncharacterized membrane-anchored protein YitT (DUF2179 family)